MLLTNAEKLQHNTSSGSVWPEEEGGGGEEEEEEEGGGGNEVHLGLPCGRQK